MKKMFVVCILLASMSLFAAFATAGPPQKSSPRDAYADMLETKLSNCQSKQAYGRSRLASMRETAAKAKLKAHFIKTHRAELLAQMQAQALEPGSAGAHHFINSRFVTYADGLKAYYSQFLTTKIAQNKAKLSYGRSRWDSMRRKATLSALKANFLETNRDDLVTRMIGANLGRRPAKLEHFVNSRFNAFVHPELMAYFLTGQ